MQCLRRHSLWNRNGENKTLIIPSHFLRSLGLISSPPLSIIECYREVCTAKINPWDALVCSWSERVCWGWVLGDRGEGHRRRALFSFHSMVTPDLTWPSSPTATAMNRQDAQNFTPRSFPSLFMNPPHVLRHLFCPHDSSCLTPGCQSFWAGATGRNLLSTCSVPGRCWMFYLCDSVNPLNDLPGKMMVFPIDLSESWGNCPKAT